MKVRASVKKICNKCKVIRRKGRGADAVREHQAQAASGIVRRSMTSRSLAVRD